MTCRSCGAPILWARTSNGRRMPLDPEPARDGNVLVRATGPDGVPVVDVVGPPTPDDLGRVRTATRYRSHFATCPNADAHRRGRS